VRQANPRTVVVLVSSFPYAMNAVQQSAPAILHMAHSSQEEGNALADVLFGDYNPGGRLSVTWPKSLNDLPPMMDYDIRKGRTYMYSKAESQYAFGYGLSYTTFEYANLKTSAETVAGTGDITVSVDVKNTGTRAGDEVAQMYVKYEGSAVERPIKQLRGFQRITLQPGETRTVRIPLKGSDLSYWDAEKHSFVVEAGKIDVLVGASSADVRLQKTLTVTP
jgi:beta-glucosidase